MFCQATQPINWSGFFNRLDFKQFPSYTWALKSFWGVWNHNQWSQSSMKFRNLQVLQQPVLGSMMLLSSCLRKKLKCVTTVSLSDPRSWKYGQDISFWTNPTHAGLWREDWILFQKKCSRQLTNFINCCSVITKNIFNVVQKAGIF